MLILEFRLFFRQGTWEPRVFPKGSSLLFFPVVFFFFFPVGGNWHFIYLGVCYDSELTDTTLSKLSLFTNGRYFNLIAPYHPAPEPPPTSQAQRSSSTTASCSSWGRFLLSPSRMAPCPAQPRAGRETRAPGRTRRHQVCLCQPRLGAPGPGRSWRGRTAKGKLKQTGRDVEVAVKMVLVARTKKNEV